MSLPIRSLPIVEHWDCHNCTWCCRGTVVPLTEDDLAKLEAQHWREHEDFRRTPVVVRQSWASKRKVLAKRSDGSCVFLMSDGRCRIHLEHGIEAKPVVCQTYPLELVPHEKDAFLTLRRSCPSAASSRGAKLTLERPDVRRLLRRQKDKLKPHPVPRLTQKYTLPWEGLARVLQTLSRLMSDTHYPVVRRIVHGLLVCDSLQLCDPRQLDAREQGELLAILKESVLEEASSLFRERKPPTRSALGMLHQSVFQFLRLHPAVEVKETWRDRWMLTKAGFCFLRGRGDIPDLGLLTQPATFESIEKPLGPLAPAIAEPLSLFLETVAASSRYALRRSAGWSVLDGFRALALAYVAGMWLARLLSTQSPLTRDGMVNIVVALDRGQGFGPLINARHRQRIRGLAHQGQLSGLVAWYAQ